VGIIGYCLERTPSCSDAEPTKLSWAVWFASPCPHNSGADVDHRAGVDVNYLIIKTHLPLALKKDIDLLQF